jgi:hypothetical protein
VPVALVAVHIEVGPEDVRNQDQEMDMRPATSRPRVPFSTEPDSYGIFRRYTYGKPLFTPDEFYTIADAVNSPNLAVNPSSAARKWFSPFGSSFKNIEASVTLSYAPFPNISIFRLMSWYYNMSNTKSIGELNKLVSEVILAKDFQPDHFIGFTAGKELKRLGAEQPVPLTTSEANTASLPFSAEDGWIETSVLISCPCDGVSHSSEEAAPKYSVKGLFYRRPLEVLKAALSEPGAEKFHTTPFKSYWKPGPNEPEERIYSEGYTADIFNEEYEDIRAKVPLGRPEPVVVGIFSYSDSTHLTSFGTASLWPLYFFIANQSKYTRAKPSSFAAHHVAYIPKVSSL